MDFTEVEKDLHTHHQLQRFIDLQWDGTKAFATLLFLE